MKIETDESFYKSDDGIYQRSSAIKTFESCSWTYYCNYFLKIPQADNNGALMGNVCHSFFECLLNPRHKAFFTSITAKGTVCAETATERLVRKLIKRNRLPATKEVFDKIDSMILVGLKTDFYVKGAKIVGKEYRFKIKNESPKYSLYGTIDKIALTKKHIIIDDFKSSKMKYSGEDAESGIQALVYSLACSKLWPDRKPKVRFVFLQYPDEPHQEAEFTEEQLKGFEYYLEAMQKKFDSFSEKDAYKNFAADQPIPEDGSFGGRLSCGYAKKLGQLKKDGSLMWHCPYKFAFKYFQFKKDGKVIKSYLKKADIILGEGETIEEVDYAGCPRYRDTVNQIPDTKIAVFQNKNVLDDF